MTYMFLWYTLIPSTHNSRLQIVHFTTPSSDNKYVFCVWCFAAQYHSEVLTALFVYEYFLTLPQEINYIWQRPKSMAAILFFLNRYISFVNRGLQFIQSVQLRGGAKPVTNNVSLALVYLYMNSIWCVITDVEFSSAIPWRSLLRSFDRCNVIWRFSDGCRIVAYLVLARENWFFRLWFCAGQPPFLFHSLLSTTHICNLAEKPLYVCYRALIWLSASRNIFSEYPKYSWLFLAWYTRHSMPLQSFFTFQILGPFPGARNFFCQLKWGKNLVSFLLSVVCLMLCINMWMQ
jgi:hypothetical protein